MRDNKTLGLNYYADMKDATLSDLLRQASINTDIQLMDFSDSSWLDCPDTGIITGAYIIFYLGGPTDDFTHVIGPVSQSSSESEYNAACTAGMDLAHFRMLINELLNNDSYIVPEESPIIILDIKSAMCMDKSGKVTNHNRGIAIIVHFLRNSEK